jgi:hypothetical protein
MLDFIKENKIIVGSVFAIILILAALGFIIFSPSTQEQGAPDNTNPFGDTGENRSTDYTTNDFLFGTTSEKWANQNIGSEAPLLRALSKWPVAGATVFENTVDGSKVEYARYVLQNNGNIFETPLATIGTENLVSNETIFRIGVVNWSLNGVTALTHYLDKTQQNITTHLRSALLSTNTDATQMFTGQILDDDIRAAAVSPSGEKIFYLKKSEDGTQGYIETVKTGIKKLVWSSALSDISTSWNTEDVVLIYTNPSSVAEGAVWALNPETGKSFVVFANTLALNAKTNNAGSKILYSMQETQNSVFSLRVLDVVTNSVTHLPVATMVEKCAWGPKDSKYVYCAIPRNTVSGGYLEEWYMGMKNSDDIIWRIDTGSNTTKKILDPFEETKEHFDIEDLVVSPNEDYLVFRTRVNDVLWSLKLPTTTGE